MRLHGAFQRTGQRTEEPPQQHGCECRDNAEHARQGQIRVRGVAGLRRGRPMVELAVWSRSPGQSSVRTTSTLRSAWFTTFAAVVPSR